jgi:D-alanyl-D-alanine-carboxypeptidase/D-alanyl-D-alanine-endopeptidase
MVERGEAKLNDPAAAYLPPGVTMPERDGKQITLVELATHTSGLPRIPWNMTPKDPGNPYADYSMDQLYQFLSTYQLTRDPGASWEYSNLGFGLLGDLLAHRAGEDYETLLKTRVLAPLRMRETTIALTPDEAQRLAVGHDAHLQKTENWDIPTLAGAGALRSTANDMLTFLSANLGYRDTPLKGALRSMLQVDAPTSIPDDRQALGWDVRLFKDAKIVWHNGGTGGYRTFMGFDRKTRTGVVVLTNTANAAGPDDIGFHILTGAPLAPASLAQN